MEFVP